MDASPLGSWDNFYVIVGSSAAALTGLQFVVMALVSDVRVRSATTESVDAFGTPNVVHFSAVLLASAILTAPWRSLLTLAIVLGTIAAAGAIYTAIVIRRARRQTDYEPVLEDWIFHAVLPLIAYVMGAAVAFVLPLHPEGALFVVAAASLVLLFVGIHNAWDTATYIATGANERSESSSPKS
jgi:hypothetical protein